MNILISPNAFKGALTARKAAEAIKAGFVKSSLEGNFDIFPIADGGDGTLELMVDVLEGRPINKQVQDPLGRSMEAGFGYIPSLKMAIVELASASGIHLLKDEEKNPLVTSTYGTGQLIKEALNMGVEEIVIGVGGSATIDAGIGMLQALGVSFRDTAGKEVGFGAKGLSEITLIDKSRLDTRLKACQITVACDVDSPFVGKEGAAQVFGPQKGATQEMIPTIENALMHFRGLIMTNFGVDLFKSPYMGAAGGASAGLFSILGAKLVNGLEFILDKLDYDSVLKKTDLVISAEGSLDLQTLSGKGPAGLAKLAKKFNVPVVVLAGKVADELNVKDFDNIEAVFSINPGPQNLERAIVETAKNLERTAEQIGNLINLVIQTKKSGI